jgi:molybdenum-dependent DNA-binding transcriptional regulator ModE
MDRLTGMETFVRVVELGGFTAAAAASNISPTMVSNHIRALERRLGARLLNRTTRRQSLTPAGTSTSSTRGRVKIPHLAMAGRVMITRFDAPWQDARRIL